MTRSVFFTPSAALFCGMLALVAFSQTALAGSLDLLPGRWTGFGKIRMSNNKTERVKCVATFFLKERGRLLNHNMRCASPSYRIDATADLQVNGGRLQGQWAERTYSVAGAAAGRVNGSGLDLVIRGRDFEASMALTNLTRCRQSITVTPKHGLEIARLSIGLSRGC